MSRQGDDCVNLNVKTAKICLNRRTRGQRHCQELHSNLVKLLEVIKRIQVNAVTNGVFEARPGSLRDGLKVAERLAHLVAERLPDAIAILIERTLASQEYE